MQTYSKLSSGITKSSVWGTPLHVRVVWISFLAEKDQNGFVGASRSGMQRISNVTPEQFEEAVKVLESPDPDSRTPDYEGRRLEKVDGGWFVLNHLLYRDQLSCSAEAARKREQRKNGTSQDIVRPPVSVFVSECVSNSNSKEKSAEKRNQYSIPPTLEEVNAYCEGRSNGIDAQTFIDHYTTTGWMRGKNKVKDWQCCVRTWEGRNKQNQGKSTGEGRTMEEMYG